MAIRSFLVPLVLMMAPAGVIFWAGRPASPALARAADAPDRGLVGYWKLAGDARDSSGHGNHGTAHGIGAASGQFDGRASYIEVPDSASLRFGTNDFSVTAQVEARIDVNGLAGDVLSKFDPESRRGFQFAMTSSAAGYNAPSATRQIVFGTDNGSEGVWTDCGRPGDKCHNSDALTVFDGHLYVGTTDGPTVDDWCHVYRTRGDGRWEDCGRVGRGRTRGVYALIVHNDELIAATSASHGRQPATMDFGRVYRYRGGTDWEDMGQPGANYRLNSLASYHGRLYVCGFNIGPDPGHVYVYEGGTTWRECGEFAGWPHTLTVHAGRLVTAYPKGEVYVFDGGVWRNRGNPFGSLDECNQIHSLGVIRGELHAGTWPKGRVAVWRDERWHDRGRPGDATEVVSLTTYNGSAYVGTIPRAELFRLDHDRWTSVRRLFDPPGFEPVPVGSTEWTRVADWSRASSLTVFDGRLFASTATCHRTMLESPLPEEPRGRVYAYETGNCISYDQDLGAGRKHIAIVRVAGVLQVYVDGRCVVQSEPGRQALDISTAAPLRIGFGPQTHFFGTIREVRLYNRALSEDEVRSLVESKG